jgi:hypothetical protein
MNTPKPKPKPKKLTDSQKREQVLKDFGMTISPKGVDAAEAAAKAALEKKYPGMFIPQTRRTPGINRAR